jgi:phosphoglycolate phosphatase
MTVKVIVFDFDGTIADTFDSIVNIINHLSVEFGYQKASSEDVNKLRNLNSREIIKYSGVSLLKLPFLVKRVKSELNKEIHRLSPASGIREVLLELQCQGNKLGIITSNSKSNVIAFLQNNELQAPFDFIYSGTTLFGKSKVIGRLLQQENLSPGEVIYVGDETRDIEAAKRTPIKVIAVSWGFNSSQALAEQNPDFLIHHPRELIEVIRSLQDPVSPN